MFNPGRKFPTVISISAILVMLSLSLSIPAYASKMAFIIIRWVQARWTVRPKESRSIFGMAALLIP